MALQLVVTGQFFVITALLLSIAVLLNDRSVKNRVIASLQKRLQEYAAAEKAEKDAASAERQEKRTKINDALRRKSLTGIPAEQVVE